MKKIIFIVSLLILSCNKNHDLGIKWSEGFPVDFSTNDKIIMVDFYADACTPCLRMEKETFSDRIVNQFLIQNFRCYRINNWKKENESIQQKYRVYEIPTIIFFNNKGEEIERLISFMEAKSFLNEIKRIEKGEYTYLDLKKRLKNDPNNDELIYQLAKKEARIGRKGDNASQKLWKKLANVSKEKTYKHDFALLNYYTGILWKTEIPDSLIQFLHDINDYDFNQDGYKTVIDFFSYKKDENNELKYYKKYSDILYQKKCTNDKALKFLNSYAFRMTEFNTNISDASMKIDHVLSNLPQNISNYDKADILYTKVEIYLNLNEKAKALELINKCITLLPDNNYLKEKKNQIENDISTSS